MQATNSIAPATVATMDWMSVRRTFRGPDSAFLLILFSSIIAVTSTTYAQPPVPRTAVVEDREIVASNQVVILVPNVTCYGRFHDSLREHLQQKHDWIHRVTIRNTGNVRNPRTNHVAGSDLTPVGGSGELPFDIGTIAELTFTIDSSRSTIDLLKAIRDSRQYSLARWTVRVEVGVEEFLSR